MRGEEEIQPGTIPTPTEFVPFASSAAWAIVENDFKEEGRAVDIALLRALALGGKRSVEIQFLLNSQLPNSPNMAMQNCQPLALLLADQSVPEDRARKTFELLIQHQTRMREALGRPVGIKPAAMDYVENIERALNLKEDEQALTYAQLAQMAFRDQLTGLANFRYFSRRINEEIKRAQRYHSLLSVLMLDIDFFKQFNDTHGHLTGNHALEHLGRILRVEVRETDLVARYGGEEFAVILPETTKREAGMLAERIREHVADNPVPVAGREPLPIRVSIGLATFPRDAKDVTTLLSAADDALYRSKREGRNRVSEFVPQTIANWMYLPQPGERIDQVHVVGEFNGWDKGADPMTRFTDGRFTFQTGLAPGKYAYKFVLNGEHFIHDPTNDQYKADGYGGRNSILVVK